MTLIEERIPRGLQIAAKYAIRSHHLHHRMGAVIIKNGRVINWGINQNKSHPKSNTCGRDGTRIQSVHAELDAVIGVPREMLNAAQIYVIRLTKKGTMGTSKPCVACAALLETLNLKSITYIDESGKICLKKF